MRLPCRGVVKLAGTLAKVRKSWSRQWWPACDLLANVDEEVVSPREPGGVMCYSELKEAHWDEPLTLPPVPVRDGTGPAPIGTMCEVLVL